jgi:hypothetical protein
MVKRLRTAASRHRQASDRLQAATGDLYTAMREAADRGMSRREIADAVGISFQRVQQVVKAKP